MSLVLWTEEDDGVSLGDPLKLMAEWSGLAKAIGKQEAKFAQLLAVPYTNEEQQPPEWIAAVQKQAAAAQKLPGLSDHVLWALDRIARLDTSADFDEAPEEEEEEAPVAEKEKHMAKAKSEKQSGAMAGLKMAGGAAAGAAAGSLIGPVGAAVGAVVGGIAGAHAKEIAASQPVKSLTSATKKTVTRALSKKASKKATKKTAKTPANKAATKKSTAKSGAPKKKVKRTK